MSCGGTGIAGVDAGSSVGSFDRNPNAYGALHGDGDYTPAYYTASVALSQNTYAFIVTGKA